MLLNILQCSGQPHSKELSGPKSTVQKPGSITTSSISVAITRTRIDGLGVPPTKLEPWGTGVQPGSVLHPRLETMPGTFDSQILSLHPCPGSRHQREDAGPAYLMGREKKSVFRMKTKIPSMGECAYDETRRPSHFRVITK